MNEYNISFKEVGRDRIGHIYYRGPLDRYGVIEFFGLDRSDVEWYEITEVNE